MNKMREDNVAQIGDIFLLNSRKINKSFGNDPNDIVIWNRFLDKGSPSLILNDVLLYLERISKDGNINSEQLKRFYHNFMQLVSYIAENLKISVSQIFEDTEWLEKSLKSYTSITNMQNLIQFVIQYFNDLTNMKQEPELHVDAIIQYIQNNLENDIRRSDIAKSVYLNPNYVSRLFKSVMNISLKEYIIKEKMKLARTLLKGTSLPINVVAAKVGYTNFSHFSQTYKTVFGCSPHDDRKVV